MAQRDPTFQKFTAKEGKAYAASRGIQYPAKLFEEILDFHKSSGGKTSLAVDLGCGPGNAARGLTSYFDNVLGLDNSAGMIEAAKSIQAGEPDVTNISFAECAGERLADDAGLAEGSVDLVTCAVSIHWLDLPVFYQSAARVLARRGTIAAWAGAPPEACSAAPYAAAINSIFSGMWQVLNPYKMPGNLLVDNLYKDVTLPWQTTPPNENYAKDEFKWTVFSSENGNALMKSYTVTVTQLEQSFRSASPYIRWREDNPDLVDTEKDVLRSAMAKMRNVLGDGEETLDMEVKVALLLIKRT